MLVSLHLRHAVGLAALACTLPALAADPALESRIARIEAGLQQPVVLEGVAPPRFALAAEMARLHVPGLSVAVIRGGEIEWVKGYGVARPDGAAVTPQTLFQAGSVSKPVAAMAALKLVESGRLELDRDVNTMLKSWKLQKDDLNSPVTLRQLLSHTAGVTVHGFPGYAAGARVPTVVQVLNGSPPANTRLVRVDQRPGSAWRYSGGGYTVAQLLMTERSGLAFPDLLRDSVLQAVGMADSTYQQPLPAALQPRAAAPYDSDGKPIAGGAYTYPEMAAAGLWTTPTDLAKLAIEVQRSAAGQSNRVLSQSMTNLMLNPVKNDDGLGWFVDGEGQARSFSHNGGNTGFQTVMAAYTERGDGAVVMTNGDAGSGLATALLAAIANEYGWPGYKNEKRRAIAPDVATALAMAGNYTVPGAGDFSITLVDGKLMVSLRGAAPEALYAASSDTYFVLSRPLELRFAPGAPRKGRLLSGGFDGAFNRVEPKP